MALKGVVLDTNAYGKFKAGEPGAVALLRRVPVVGLCSIVLGELLSGFVVGSREAANREELRRFLGRPRVRLLAVDEEVAEHYAAVYRSLKRSGQPIPTNDMWIAATALRHDLAVFTYDRHFRYVEGLLTGSALEHFLT